MTNKETEKSAYLITRVSFDSLENTTSAAICKDPVGVIIGTDEDVQKWCDSKKSSTKTYKGWDGCEYPYYEATAINILNVEGIIMSKKQ